MKKRNWFLILIVIIAALLIAMVILIYGKRIEHIEHKMKVSPISIRARLMAHICGDDRRN